MSGPVYQSLNISFLPLVCLHWTLDYGIIHSYFLKSSLNCTLNSWALSIRLFYAFIFFRAYWFTILFQALKLILQNTICSIYSQKDAFLKGLQFSRLALGESPSLWDDNYLEAPQSSHAYFQKLVKRSSLETDHIHCYVLKHLSQNV